MNPLHPLYHHYLECLDVAFQPIVDIHSGSIYGVEALLRGTDTLGFDSIFAFFDRLWEDEVLYAFDLELRRKVIQKFSMIKGYEKLKLFYNLDNRVLEMSDFSKGNTSAILSNYGIDKKAIVFELSERNEIVRFDHFMALMEHYAQEGYNVAIDDFGIGQSGYKMLYHTTPDIIKIDRFFLSSIDSDPKKKILVRHIVNLATLMGCRVIAEGVETEAELLVCKEIGCHMVQGYFVQRPTVDLNMLQSRYSHVATESIRDKRSKMNQNIILSRIEPLKAIKINDSMEMLLDWFKQQPDAQFVPVVDLQGVPLGIVHEHRLKSIIYSPYGRSLLQNRSCTVSDLESHVENIPIVNSATSMETMVELFSSCENAPGVLITDSTQYIGYLSARVMIGIIHERNLIRARDQNPLTRLPGNFMINEYVTDVFESGSRAVLVYFDFDHFKPYNDHYGFRNGDRVILLFADLMNKYLPSHYFKGHIGGDDFFVGVDLDEKTSFEQVLEMIKGIIQKFRDDVREFYDPKDREQGYIIANDRDGNKRNFELMGVSAVIIDFDEQSSFISCEHLHELFASEKKKAKAADNHICVVSHVGSI